MALYYELQVFKDVYTLVQKVFSYTQDFPREYKYTLGQDMKRDAIQLVRSIYRANKAKKWRDRNAEKDGNIRDYATLEQLVVLSNMESINALLIRQDLTQNERLTQLNKAAITQMKSLVESKAMKKLK